MKEFKCYYIEEGKMQNVNIFAKTEKNARDRMRRKGILCKAILEQQEINIDTAILMQRLMQCGYEEREAAYIVHLVDENV